MRRPARTSRTGRSDSSGMRDWSLKSSYDAPIPSRRRLFSILAYTGCSRRPVQPVSLRRVGSTLGSSASYTLKRERETRTRALKCRAE